MPPAVRMTEVEIITRWGSSHVGHRPEKDQPDAVVGTEKER